jgi:hypothetical protein
MVDQPHLPGDIRSPMPAQPRQVCYPACAAVPAPGTVPSGRCRPPARTHQKTMPSIPFSDCKTLVESESKKIPNQKIRIWGHGPPLLSWGPRRAHCTSPGTTTHAAAPKNDIMLFVAVLPRGEPENTELVMRHLQKRNDRALNALVADNERTGQRARQTLCTLVAPQRARLGLWAGLVLPGVGATQK